MIHQPLLILKAQSSNPLAASALTIANVRKCDRQIPENRIPLFRDIEYIRYRLNQVFLNL
ncbi:MAG: hypothetical protein JGK17_29655 [Microcoleus sp. PH2017_10_PVI_O_A]|uniref:hypothetical protein n=1 Tax=unclassified Microcoleus TaxID=2642155 RepID=UPI001D8B6ECB|nr:MULTISPECIES: hypothetical protein [unclassified Microcoleus]TAE74732.1 MAG: hypothetical protein EAZ83_30085 [Oscillatoriales cyanobacterium]MCC3409643.1 hypothetical protein [Microcoleus sp. PH2017_10_PVI_O_A]MCC3463898.1 hypothetical protein [Microcoleus sp. PH2017_11_PCY_U_A]MCC3482244.1 hypothetical protein [Microcoleus sp. PH2017_12_PCY_D_A]MCC3531977.1 hypothetical protein [Microcoleus sp. PH2017_21_RUC_O_A]